MENRALAGIFVAILIIAKIVVFSVDTGGAVTLNPLGWFGYGQRRQVSIDRQSKPGGILEDRIEVRLIAFAAFLALFIWPVGFRGSS